MGLDLTRLQLRTDCTRSCRPNSATREELVQEISRPCESILWPSSSKLQRRQVATWEDQFFIKMGPRTHAHLVRARRDESEFRLAQVDSATEHTVRPNEVRLGVEQLRLEFRLACVRDHRNGRHNGESVVYAGARSCEVSRSACAQGRGASFDISTQCSFHRPQRLTDERIRITIESAANLSSHASRNCQ
eukprot:6178241-Pleurochrysis_carterae.AAC.4